MSEATRMSRFPETGLLPVTAQGQDLPVRVTALGGGHGLYGSLSARSDCRGDRGGRRRLLG